MAPDVDKAKAEAFAGKMLDVLNNQANQALSLLKDKKVTDFVNAA